MQSGIAKKRLDLRTIFFSGNDAHACVSSWDRYHKAIPATPWALLAKAGRKKLFIGVLTVEKTVIRFRSNRHFRRRE